MLQVFLKGNEALANVPNEGTTGWCMGAISMYTCIHNKARHANHVQPSELKPEH
jgi:hypothetical protein